MEFTQDVFAEQMKPITGSAIRQVFHLLAAILRRTRWTSIP